MIFSNNNKVELIKFNYYNEKLYKIPTISQNISNTNQLILYKKNISIKRSIFGKKLIFKINENRNKLKTKTKSTILLYLLLILALICFISIIYSLFQLFDVDSINENNSIYYNNPAAINPTTTDSTMNQTTIESNSNTIDNLITDSNTIKSNNSIYCNNCLENLEICLKLIEIDKPKCVKILNFNDPTGCGGLCQINTQFCQLLDTKSRVYQCSNLIKKNYLKCPLNYFNCNGRLCIPLNRRCDGKIHCRNYLDEKNCDCNLKTHFQCGNSTSCLIKSKKCDGIVDCWDKSDECYCNKYKECFDGKIRCLNGECIEKQKICDGIYDCTDKSDEFKGC